MSDENLTLNTDDAKAGGFKQVKTDETIQVNQTYFKKKYNLSEPGDMVLREPLQNFDFSNPPMDPVELAQELVGHMRHYGGIGLSANQLGLPYRVFCMEGEPSMVCFNPVITATAGEDIMLDEGCLTYPGFYLKKTRPSLVRVRFTDPFGDASVQKFTGMTARCFQHEMEHMEGQNFMMGVSSFKLQRAKQAQDKLYKKLKKQQKALAKQVKRIR